MSLLKKQLRFFAALFLFTALVAGKRLYWIQKSIPSTAHVLFTDYTYLKRKHYYHTVQYQTISGTVRAYGSYELPISPGQNVQILYDPDDVEDFMINTPYWLWMDIWDWYRFILITIALYFVTLFFVKRSQRPKSYELVFFEAPAIGEIPPELTERKMGNSQISGS